VQSDLNFIEKVLLDYFETSKFVLMLDKVYVLVILKCFFGLNPLKVFFERGVVENEIEV